MIIVYFFLTSTFVFKTAQCFNYILGEWLKGTYDN